MIKYLTSIELSTFSRTIFESCHLSPTAGRMWSILPKKTFSKTNLDLTVISAVTSSALCSWKECGILGGRLLSWANGLGAPLSFPMSNNQNADPNRNDEEPNEVIELLSSDDEEEAVDIESGVVTSHFLHLFFLANPLIYIKPTTPKIPMPSIFSRSFRILSTSLLKSEHKFLQKGNLLAPVEINYPSIIQCIIDTASYGHVLH